MPRHVWFWITLLVSGLVAILVLAIVFTPAPLSVLPARVAFAVESVSFDPQIVEGDEGTHFSALITYENQGPARVGGVYNLIISALSEEDGILFDTRNDFSPTIERDEVRSVVFDGPLSGSWDAAVFGVIIKIHDGFRLSYHTGYFWLGQPLILEI